MERDCLLAHGTGQFVKERLLDMSDKFRVYVCKQCGMFVTAGNPYKNIYFCKACNNSTNITEVHLPYAYKLLTQELMSLSIVPKIITE
jgi:DNA-directed RNA polymerase II subunit RPB2